MNTHIKKHVEKLTAVINSNKGRNFIIFAVQVDPDAIGSAMGLRAIIRHLLPDSRVSIYYGGSISHPQNRMLINRFGLSDPFFSHISKFRGEDGDCCFCLVDSGQAPDKRLGDIQFIPKIVIDHHRNCNVPECEGTFIWTEDIGSACTMIAEIISEMGINVSENGKIVATLLTVGIYTDTNGLISSSATARDRHAFVQLSGIVDSAELIKCFNYPIPASHFVNQDRALQRVTIKDAKLVTNIGVISPAEGDDLSTFADEMIRREGVSLVIIWCIMKGNSGKVLVRMSARNTDSTRDLGGFLRERFGPNCGAKVAEDGCGMGGGILEIPFDYWFCDATEVEVEKLVAKFIEFKTFEE